MMRSILSLCFLTIWIFGSVWCLPPKATKFKFNYDFRLDVEIIDLKQKPVTSIFVQSYQKAMNFNDTGAIVVKRQGTIGQYIILPKYQKGYSFKVYPGTDNCKAQKLSTPIPDSILPQKYVYNWEIKANFGSYRHFREKLFIGPASMIYNITSQSELKFLGYTDISGVNCSHFLYSKFGYFNASYYEAAEKKSGYKSGQAVRVTLDGNIPKGTLIRKEYDNVNIIYNIMPIHKLSDSDRVKYFQLPIGIGCPSLSNLQPKRYDGGYFFSAEGTTLKGTDDNSAQQNQVVNDIWVAYEAGYGYQSVKYTRFIGQFPTYPVVQTKLLKYSYTYTDNFISCSVKRDTSTTLEFEIGNGSIFQWPTASALMDFSKGLFLGQRRKHGIDCNIFEKIVTKTGVNDDGTPQSVVTLYESASESTIYGPLGSQVNVPVAMEIRQLKSNNGFQSQKLVELAFSNFYDLGILSVPPSMRFSKVCTNTEDSALSIRLNYEASTKFFSDNYLGDLRASIPDAIAQTALIMPFQVYVASIVHTAYGEFLARVLIQSRPSAQLDFKLKASKKILSGKSVIKGNQIVLHEDDCAKSCIISDKPSSCKYYSYCNFNCHLYIGATGTTPTLSAVQTAEYCVTKQRISGDNSMPFQENIITSIELSLPDSPPAIDVDDNPMNIEFTGDRMSDDLTFKFKNFTTDGVENKNYQSSHPAGPDFKVQKINVRLLKTISGEQTRSYRLASIGSGCYDYCKENGDFFCNSYSFCANSGLCIISSINALHVNINNSVAAESCFVLSRNYISQYKKSPGVILQEKGFQTITATSAGDCAMACADVVLFETCESFDWCSSNKNCVMHHSHILDVTKSSDVAHSAKCNHYSRDFMLDFLHEGAKKMNTAAVSESVTNITGENCAKQCSMSKYCVGYDYCDAPVSTCRMTTLKLGDPNLKFTESLRCNHFSIISSRLKLKIPAATSAATPTATPKPNNADAAKASGQKSVKRFSSGAAIGAAIGMMAVGGVISAIAVFIYARRRAAKY